MRLQNLDRYTIVKPIGKWELGLLYEAHDPNINRVVALKTIRLDDVSTALAAAYEARFRSETQEGGRLQHPNIIGVYDAGRDQGVAFMVTELVSGGSLQQQLDTGAPTSFDRAMAIMRDLLMALDFGHGHGIVHSDVRPANLLLDSNSRIKLAGFGASQISEAGGVTRTDGPVADTLNYLSPEQVMGGHVDVRADLFSAGAVLYRLVTGRLAFSGERDVEIFRAITEHRPQLPSTFALGLPAGLDTVIARALAKNRDERFSSAKDFAMALKGLAPPVAPPSPGINNNLAPSRNSAKPSTVPLSASTGGPRKSETGDAAAAAVVQEMELLYWKDIQNSTDPEDFRAFLKQFPKGVYAGLAQRRLRRFEAAPSEASESGGGQTSPPAAPDQGTASASDATLLAPASLVALIPSGAEREAAIRRTAEEAARRQVDDARRTRAGDSRVRRETSQADLASVADKSREAERIDGERLVAEGRRAKEAAAAEVLRRAKEAEAAAQALEKERARQAEEERAAEAAREAAEGRKAEEARLAEAQRLAREAEAAEQARLAEAARVAALAAEAERVRQAEEAARAAREAEAAAQALERERVRRAAEERAAQAAREADERRKAEEARIAEAQRLAREAEAAEQARLAEAARVAALAAEAERVRLAEEARVALEAERRRKAEEERQAELFRQAREAEAAERLRLAEEAKAKALALDAERARRAEEERAALAAREAERAAKAAEEESLRAAAAQAERERQAEEARMVQELLQQQQAELERLRAELLQKTKESEAARKEREAQIELENRRALEADEARQAAAARLAELQKLEQRERTVAAELTAQAEQSAAPDRWLPEARVHPDPFDTTELPFDEDATRLLVARDRKAPDQPRDPVTSNVQTSDAEPVPVNEWHLHDEPPSAQVPLYLSAKTAPENRKKPQTARMLAIAATVAILGGAGAWWAVGSGDKHPDAATPPSRALDSAVASTVDVQASPAARPASEVQVKESTSSAEALAASATPPVAQAAPSPQSTPEPSSGEAPKPAPAPTTAQVPSDVTLTAPLPSTGPSYESASALERTNLNRAIAAYRSIAKTAGTIDAARSARRLWEIYRDGGKGVASDAGLAQQWYERAQALGAVVPAWPTSAQSAQASADVTLTTPLPNTGPSYESALALERADLTRAISAYRAIAKTAGTVAAARSARRLWEIYRDGGQGVASDASQAQLWYERARALGAVLPAWSSSIQSPPSAVPSPAVATPPPPALDPSANSSSSRQVSKANSQPVSSKASPDVTLTSPLPNTGPSYEWASSMERTDLSLAISAYRSITRNAGTVAAARAARRLWEIYRDGGKGVASDTGQAQQWYVRAQTLGAVMPAWSPPVQPTQATPAP